MKRRNLMFLVGIFVALLVITSVVAFRFTSSTYNGRGKFDFGGAGTNATSSSFTQRFISGMQPVSRYTTASFNGRFGILDDVSAVATLLNINFTYPSNLQEIVRGSDNETGEDDLSQVANVINLTAQVFDGAGSGVSGANCYFYDGASLLGNATTNSSGDCYVAYNKTSYNTTLRNLKVNYTAAASLGTVNISEDNSNISLAKYVAILTMENLRSNGKYYDGDEAVLSIKIRKSNATSSDLLYTPQNLSANAENSAGTSRGLNYYPGNVSLLSSGNLTTNVTVTYGAGANAFIKWEVNYSDDGFVTYIGSALHADEDVCAGDFGNWSDFSACSGGTQTRSRTDSSSCTEVESQSCTSSGGGGGGCSNVCTSGSVQDSCVSGFEGIQSRTCGDFDGNGCTEWGSWSVTQQCSSGQVCQSAQCVGVCQESWSCSQWGECSNGVQTRSCSDANSCGTTNNAPSTSRSCNVPVPVELPDIVTLPDGSQCVTNFVCDEWGPCEATYGFSDVLEGKTSVFGFQERTCVDKNQCTLEKVQSQQCDFRVPIIATRTKWCYEDYVEIYDVSQGQLLGRVKEDVVSQTLNLKKFDAFFTGVIGSNFTGYCAYCHDGIKNYDETGVDCGGSNCPSCTNLISFFNWLPYLIWILWLLFVLSLIAGLIVERREVSRVGDRVTFGLGEKVLTESHSEKEFERRLVKRFKELGFEIPSLPSMHVKFKVPEVVIEKPHVRLPDFKFKERREIGISDVHEKGLERLKEIERSLRLKERAVALELARIKEHTRLSARAYAARYRETGEAEGLKFRFETSRRSDLLAGLRKKLKMWKEEGYYGTALLEKKIENYKLETERKVGYEKSRLKRFVANARRKRTLARKEKELRRIVEEREKLKAKESAQKKKALESYAHKVKEHLKKQRKAVAKTIRIREKEKIKSARAKTKAMIHEGIRKIKIRESHEKKIKKVEKKIAREKRKVVNGKISNLKREVRNRKIARLLSKLKMWKKEGYYGTAALEAEIKRLKEQR